MNEQKYTNLDFCYYFGGRGEDLGDALIQIKEEEKYLFEFLVSYLVSICSDFTN